MSRHETPGDIIASLTRRHSQDGYVSHSELCRAYEAVISRLCADLEVYRGTALIAQSRHELFDTFWGPVPVRVEMALPTTENDDPYPVVAGVLLNGHWVKVYGSEDVVPLPTQEKWVEEFMAERAEEAEAVRTDQQVEAALSWKAAA